MALPSLSVADPVPAYQVARDGGREVWYLLDRERIRRPGLVIFPGKTRAPIGRTEQSEDLSAFRASARCQKSMANL